MLSVSFSVFAEKHYTVSAVSGEALYRLNNGKWVPLKVGMNLIDSTTITTGLNSTIVISNVDSTVVILPLKTGTVSDVIVSSTEKNLIKASYYRKD